METTEGNKLIAIFDGYAEDETGKFWRNERWTSLSGLKYDSDWNRLMPVVEKIDESEFVHKEDGGVSICRIDGTTIYLNGDNPPFIHKVGSTRINGCWEAVISFIQWHNQLTQNKEI